MKLDVTKKRYPNHIAIRLLVDGKQIGWLQYEGDNIAFYGSSKKQVTDNASMVFIGNIS